MLAERQQLLVIGDVELGRIGRGIVAHAQRGLTGRMNNNDTLERGGERAQLELTAPFVRRAQLVRVLTQQNIEISAIIGHIQKRCKIVRMRHHVVSGKCAHQRDVSVGAQREHTRLISQRSIQT